MRYSNQGKEKVINRAKKVIKESGLINHISDIANDAHFTQLILQYIRQRYDYNGIIRDLEKAINSVNREDAQTLYNYTKEVIRNDSYDRTASEEEKNELYEYARYKKGGEGLHHALLVLSRKEYFIDFIRKYVLKESEI